MSVIFTCYPAQPFMFLHGVAQEWPIGCGLKEFESSVLPNASPAMTQHPQR